MYFNTIIYVLTKKATTLHRSIPDINQREGFLNFFLFRTKRTNLNEQQQQQKHNNNNKNVSRSWMICSSPHMDARCTQLYQHLNIAHATRIHAQNMTKVVCVISLESFFAKISRATMEIANNFNTIKIPKKRHTKQN